MIECKPNMATNAASLTTPSMQRALRVEHPIRINMGEYGTIDTSLEEMSEKLKKELYLNMNCGFRVGD